MKPDLTDEETEALVSELDRIIDADRYPFLPPIRDEGRDVHSPPGGPLNATWVEWLMRPPSGDRLRH
jgi:hypothetical protein